MVVEAADVHRPAGDHRLGRQPLGRNDRRGQQRAAVLPAESVDPSVPSADVHGALGGGTGPDPGRVFGPAAMESAGQPPVGIRQAVAGPQGINPLGVGRGDDQRTVRGEDGGGGKELENLGVGAPVGLKGPVRANGIKVSEFNAVVGRNVYGAIRADDRLGGPVAVAEAYMKTSKSGWGGAHRAHCRRRHRCSRCCREPERSPRWSRRKTACRSLPGGSPGRPGRWRRAFRQWGWCRCCWKRRKSSGRPR